MSLLSPRLGLTLPDSLENMSLGDDILSDAYDKIDANCHCTVVPSLVSVTSPFEGMHVYSEADSKNYIYKNGNFSQIVGQSSTSPSSGVIGYKSKDVKTTNSSFGSSTVILAQTSFNAILGNIYMFSASVSIEPDADTSAEEVQCTVNLGLTGTISSDTLVLGTMYGFNSSKRTFPLNMVTDFIMDTTGLVYVSIFGKALSNTFSVNPDGTFANIIAYDMTAVA